MTYSEWIEQAQKGTSGDMVMDILKDWYKEREVLLKVVNIFICLAGLDNFESVEDFLKDIEK